MRKPLNNLAGARNLVAAALLSAAWLAGANKGPDAGGYTATDSTVYSFIDSAGSGVASSVLSGVDDGGALLTLPFAFRYYGQNYTMVCVSTNGLAYFVTSANSSFCNSQAQMSDFANTDLTSTAIPSNLPAIAPFWADLTFAQPGSDAVYYQTIGKTVGSRQFVIEWHNAYIGTVGPITFEAVLFESNNNVLFQYQTVGLGSGNKASNGGKASVGSRNAGGNANNQQIQWSYNAPVLADSSALLISAPTNPCAVTLDTNASIVDLQAIVNQALGKSAPNNDLNADGWVNVVDIQIVMNAILTSVCTI